MNKFSLNKTVLIVSYYFAPSSSTGGTRALKFTKYLNEFEWKPIVLCSKSGFDFYVQQNLQLLKEIPEQAVIYRTFSFEILNWIWKLKNSKKTLLANKKLKQEKISKNDNQKSRMLTMKGFIEELLSIPDRFTGWIPFAVIKGVQIVKKHNVSAIFATTPPPSALVIGYLISKLTNKPLIVDYRDPWSDFYSKIKFIKKYDHYIEKKVLTHAKYIISVSSTRSDELNINHPELSKNKFITITNGYDLCDLKNIKITKTYEKLTFLHAGQLYGMEAVQGFLDSISEIIKSNSVFINFIQIIFIGTKPEAKSFHALEKLGIVKFIRHIPKENCFQLISQSHILLTFLDDSPLSKGWILSKIFDYMMFDKFILGIVSEGETKNIIENCQIGIAVNYKNSVELQKSLLKLITNYTNGTLENIINKQNINQYNRKDLTKNLSQVLDKSLSI